MHRKLAIPSIARIRPSPAAVLHHRQRRDSASDSPGPPAGALEPSQVRLRRGRVGQTRRGTSSSADATTSNGDVLPRIAPGLIAGYEIATT
jgi:hypothetical protein